MPYKNDGLILGYCCQSRILEDFYPLGKGGPVLKNVPPPLSSDMIVMSNGLRIENRSE